MSAMAWERADGPEVQASEIGSKASPLLRLALKIAGRLRYGTLTIELPGGACHRFRGDEPGPQGHLVLRRERALRRLLTGGGAGFAEAYLAGDWDSPDLARLLELLALNHAAYEELYYGRRWHGWLARLQHLMRPNSRRGSRRNILAHYDLGNRFYELWLDRSMTYSAALFPARQTPLEDAQRAKYRRLAERLQLGEGHSLLEIGCGWGGVRRTGRARVRRAGDRRHDLRSEQHAFTAARIQAAGLAERVEVRLQDYRDVDGRFDRIASIEMFEAVGERYWPIFFDKLRELLAPAGIAGLQVITIAERHFDAYRRSVDFIQRYIFPGGMLPSPGALSAEIDACRPARDRAVHLRPPLRPHARPLAASASRPAGRRSRGTASTSASSGSGNTTWPTAKPGFRAGFTDVRQFTLAPA